MATEVIADAYRPFYNPLGVQPVLVSQHDEGIGPVVLARPLCGLLLFDNNDSDARDHCANERTFLSWLRLSIYMAVVSVAIIISFHLKSQPSAIEKRAALPLGIIFWILALACLVSGFANYLKTAMSYSNRQAIVQTGLKTQVVFMIVATAIIAACALFLSSNAQQATTVPAS
ncbi:MAG: hypothetical protein M1813_006664 [Trichoglossum hirsutum]|nr:MAG: hypothetical protein M1813_006664 [Trichoglossum hirsutum]